MTNKSYKEHEEYINENTEEILETQGEIHKINKRLEDIEKNLFLDRGLYLYLSNKDDEAIKCFNKILKIQPNNEVALYQKGWALEKLGRKKQAKRCFDRLIKIKPRYKEVIEGEMKME